MNKTIRGILITAGVIALAVFYMLYADGRLLFQKETPLEVTDGETTEGNSQTGNAATDPSDAEDKGSGSSQGFSEQEKEEIRLIVDACFREQLSAEVSTAIRQSLQESLDEMLESGRLEPAVENYLAVQSELVNINTADLEELMSLPGIGQAKATAILSYRSEHGNFESLEQLTEVSGISAKLLEQIREQITL